MTLKHIISSPVVKKNPISSSRHQTSRDYKKALASPIKQTFLIVFELYTKSGSQKEIKRQERLNKMFYTVTGSLKDYDDNLKNLSAGRNNQPMKMQHYVFSHQPLIFNADCIIDNRTIAEQKTCLKCPT